ncbi:MAG: hypothetical protein IT384_34035 [Deltaproteobacteria bacterium]|nr:hypothetical protein [Deltaproteobacteria bacterium]
MGKHVCGEEPLAAAARYLADRGHAVELHIHPEFKAHAETRVGDLEENIFRYSADAQRALIREGLDDIERWTGRRPIAFRAGAFGACPGVLEIAAQEGIRFDSSYNLWAIGQGPSGFDAALGLNDAAPLGNLLEVPVTNLAVRLSRTGLKPFELSSLSTMEMAAAAEDLWASGHRVCCSLTHSFRLVRSRERQYRRVRADGMNIHRLRALARYLRARPDRFEIVTFDDLPAQQWMAERRRSDSRPLPSPPLWASATRLAVQAFKDWGVV